MIPPDLDLAERQALATPRDFPTDMDKPSCGWQVCVNCIKAFIGKPSRELCRRCSGEQHD